MNVRLLILLLVLLIILFAVGVGVGVGQGGNLRADSAPAFVERLGALGGGPAPLRAEDMAGASPGACLDQLRQSRLLVAQGAGCIFFIRDARTPVRALRLDIAGGQTAQIIYEPGNPDRFTARQRLDADRTLELSIFQEGGELRILCANSGGADACILTVR